MWAGFDRVSANAENLMAREGESKYPNWRSPLPRMVYLCVPARVEWGRRQGETNASEGKEGRSFPDRYAPFLEDTGEGCVSGCFSDKARGLNAF
jgi:hypothetical protein